MADAFVVVCSFFSWLFCIEIVRIVINSLTFHFLDEWHLFSGSLRPALVTGVKEAQVLQVLRSRATVDTSTAMAVFVNFVYFRKLLTHFGLL